MNIYNRNDMITMGIEGPLSLALTALMALVYEDMIPDTELDF